MEADFRVSSKILIPGEELALTFVRSSGPGGQNVNKVNTKAVLRWNVTESPSLPEAIKNRFLAKYPRRINQVGELLITSQRYRDQLRNIDDCLEKLRGLILEVATPPKRRKPTKISRRQKQKRLDDKRKHSERKKSRQQRPRFDD